MRRMQRRVSSPLLPLASSAGDENQRRDEAAGGMIPAREGFETRQLAVRKPHDRLVIGRDFLTRQSALEVALHAQLVRGRVDKALIVKKERRCWRAVHGIQARQRGAKPIEDDVEHHADDRVGARHAALQLLRGDRKNHAMFDRANARRSWRAVDNRHFADDVARPPDRQHALAAGSLQHDLHAALLDQERRGRRIVLAEEILGWRKPQHDDPIAQPMRYGLLALK
jgi:hypothetical protein